MPSWLITASTTFNQLLILLPKLTFKSQRTLHLNILVLPQPPQ